MKDKSTEINKLVARINFKEQELKLLKEQLAKLQGEQNENRN